MPHGPVLSTTLDLINDGPDDNSDSPWGKLIVRARDPYCVTLASNDFSTDELSEVEEELIGQIYQKFGHMNRYALGRLLHEILPEWRDHNGSALPIEYRDILAAAKQSHQQIAEVEAEIESIAFVTTMACRPQIS